ncbi:putative Ig domain-containing protein [Spirosoma sp. SC4-14]|uniref:putative Ig domain-containing protein n=1 Tax=Spirosoma sp. SC4-14 TaxID=3128900 RepID=UPI0030CE379A
MTSLYSFLPFLPSRHLHLSAFRVAGLLLGFICIATLANGQLYYVLNDGSASTRNDQLRKRNADGTGEAFVISDFADSPGSMAIDKAGNKAYIVENRVTITPRIYAVDLTAATSTTFLTSTSIATGVAIDKTNNYLYYTASDGSGSTYSDYLRRITLNGTGDVAVGSAFAYSTGNIELDLANNRMFVAERRFGSSQIYAVNLSNGSVSTFLTPTPPASTTVTVRGMAVDAANNYLYYAVNDNDGTRTDDALWRINLDGTGNTKLATGFVYSIGDITLDKDNNRLYISDLLATDPKVAYINLNTNATATFLTPSNTSQITGLSYLSSSCPTSFIVNNLGDGTDANPGDGVCATSGGVCTLRAAIQEANALTSCPGSLSISFSVTGTINTSSALPNITRDLAITGPGASQLTISGQTNTHQLFIIQGDNLSNWFSGLTLTKGGSGSGNGAAIDAGSISTTSVSSLSVVACNLDNNSASLGHIYVYKTNLYILNSTISNNSAGDGIDTEYGGATGFLLVIQNSTISNNSYAGIYMNGNNTGTITTTNSTFSGNQIGFYIGVNCSATLNFKNSILANGTQFDGSGTKTILSQGNNICTDASLTPTSSGDLINTNPLLSSLGNYGGTTLTHALLPGSPAINAGSSSGAPSTDQRGVARVGATDIGSFESRGFTMGVTSGNNQSTVVNTAFANPLVVSVSSSNSEPVDGGVVSFAAPASGASASLSSTATISGGQASVNATANGTIGGPYSVTASAQGANNSTFSLTNTIGAPTIASFSAVVSSVCTGSPISFTATVGNVTGNYNYTLTNGSSTSVAGSTSSTAFSQALTASGTGTQSFSLIISDNSQTTRAATTITVNSLPTAGLTNNGPLSCTLTSVTLTATGGTSYTFANGSGVLGTPGPTNTLTVSSPGTYSVTVANASGCVSSTSTTVASNTATVTVTNPTTTTGVIATAFSQTFTASGGTTPYSYSLASGSLPTGLSLNSTTGVLSGTPTQSGSFPITVRATDVNGCSGTGSTYSLSIVSPPTVSVQPVSQTVCEGTVVSLSVAATNATNYQWQLSSNSSFSSPGNLGNSAQFDGVTTPVLTVSATSSVSGYYFRCVVSGPGGSVNSEGAQLIVNQPASASIVYSSTTLCKSTNETASPTIYGQGGGIFTSSPTGLSINASGQVLSSFSTPGSYTVSYTVAASGSCPAVVSTSPMTIVDAPTFVYGGGFPNVTQPTCATTTGTISVSATGNGPIEYSINNGASWQSSGLFSNLAANQSYTIRARSTDNPNCTRNLSFSINAAPSPPSVSISPTSATLTCSSPIASLSVIGTGSIHWNTGATSSVISVSTAGTYSVTLTTAGSCTASASVTIDADQTPPSVSITPTSTTLTCANPSATLTANGTGSVLWSTGETTSAITVSEAGTYSVTLTSGSGCTATASASVQADQTAPSVSITPSSTTLTCANPSVTLTANGTGSVLWSTGETTSAITVSEAGTYSVTLTSGSGCTATASASVQADQTAPSVSITPTSTTLTCANPSATLTANGTGSVLWSTGETTSAITVSEAGTYSVTLTSGSGCTATASATVQADQTAPTVSITPSSTTLTCSNPSATLTANGTGSVLWSTGETTSAITVSAAGTYSVTLTSGSGCTATASASVQADQTAPTVSITPSSTTLTCANPSATLTANGTGSVLWSTGETTSAITVSEAGTYSVTLTSGSGCTATASASVQADQTAPSVSITPSSTTLTCANPSATLTANGTGSVLWSTGETTSAITVSEAGTYSVTLTSGSGCTATASASVQADQTAPTVSITPTSTTLTCANPSATLTANGTGSVLWSTGETTSAITVSEAGTYSVTLTSGSGCTATANASVQADQTAPSVSITPTSTTLTCANPSATLTANGTGSVLWSTGETTSAITVSAAGTYSVTLTSGSGCTATASASVQADQTAPSVSITPTSTTLTCANPSATLTANGTGSVLWSTGETTSAITVSEAGTYSVTLTSGSGCTATASATVQADQTAPSVSITPTSTTLTCANPSATLTANGTGSVLWSTGETTSAITVSEAGTYSVTLTSGSGCTATANASVQADQTAPTVSITPSSTTLTCANPSATLTANGTGSVLWSTGETTSAITVSEAGTYSVTLTSGSGCTATANASVQADQTAPTVSITPTSTTLTCANPSATLTANGTGSVLWSTGETTSAITVSEAGTYSVTLTSGSGCTATANASVQADQTAPSVSITPSSTTLTCANPSVTLTANGTGSVLWSTGETTSAITVSEAGTYSVTLTSGSGCTATANASVQADQTAPTVSITPTSTTLTCANPSATLTANGTGSVLWSTGETTSAITVSEAGTYSVTLTSGSGCTATASASVQADQTAPSVSITPTSTTLTCANPSATLTANGTGSVLWSTGETTSAITVSEAGTYSVTLTSGSGCTATASASVQADQTAPTVSITPTSTTLTCANPSATLTANGTGSVLWSTGETTSAITVSAAGTYSVTLTSGSGCTATASATVIQDNNLTAPALSPSMLSTTNQPISVTATGCSGTLNWISIGGSGSADGNLYTYSQPGNYTLSATCTVNSCTSPASSPIVLTIQPGGFAIISVTMVDCQLVNTDRGEYYVTFTPAYSGLNSNPLTFSVVNEMAPTTDPAPYTLRLYNDNPTITLVANQLGNGTTQFNYNWLASCGSGHTDNHPPTTTGIASQTILQNQAYQLELTNYFNDPDQQPLSFSANNLPAGLSLTGSLISGTPTVTGVNSVSVTAVDPGGLAVGTSFLLTVTPTPNTPNFSIVDVTTLSCEALSTNQRRLSFTPQYGGTNGSPISFSVVNELAPTTNPGPYTLTLYTDNPVITLKATQVGSAGEASFSYNWLAACNGTPPGNVAPIVSNLIPNQVATVGQAFSYAIPANTFTDSNGDALTLSVTGLPSGLNFSGNTISGSPSAEGTATIVVIATDPGNLSASTSFMLTVNPEPPISSPDFSITAVSTVSCQVVSAGERVVSFNPQYAGLNGQAVTFWVVNEMPPTTTAGPYSLKLYTDNPVITLKATQVGSTGEASFSYNWLAACANASSRISAEAKPTISLQVFGNPTQEETVDVEINGLNGQAVQLQTVSEQGHLVDKKTIQHPSAVERIRLRIGPAAGLYLLQVDTGLQRQTIKIIKQ